jgi:chemotaxis protein methyltransferase CheR
MTEEEFAFLKRRIMRATRINLDNYKSNQMRRRLDTYISNSGCQNIASYCQAMEASPEMINKLRDFLTINVSEFFRDSKYFQTLQSDILPVLLDKYGRLNIWSAGCSNGAESYSIAIMLNEMSPHVHHRILATDIDERSLDKAVNGGPYRLEEIRNAPTHILDKYFTSGEDGFKTKEILKPLVQFRQHDMLQEPFEKSFNLIVCRNVVIYFSVEAKSILYQKFHESMKDDGVLFIGGTEAMLDSASLGFQMLRTCFYRKMPVNKAAPALATLTH